MKILNTKYLLILPLLIVAVGLVFLFQSQNPEINLVPDIPLNIEKANDQVQAPEETPKEKVGQVSGSTITAKQIVECLGKSGTSGTCLDKLFEEYLKGHKVSEALALVNKYEDSDSTIRLSCHPVVHAIGRNTFIKYKTVQDSFPECNQTCHSGCYHGVMERFLRGDLASNDENAHISEEEVKEKTKTACDPSQPAKFRFQCLHGLGHALLFFLDYNLESSLASCDSLPDGWSRSSCYGGIFMENVHSATPERRDLSKTDYHYPCSKLADKYKSDCYMMQTTRMSEMGLSTDQLFEECKKAGIYQQICMQSIGRDLSNGARTGDPKLVAEKCEKVKNADRQACIRGVSYALLDNTWDGKFAFPFCEAFVSEEDKSFCFGISKSYLINTFETNVAQIATQCKQFVSSSKICIQN